MRYFDVELGPLSPPDDSGDWDWWVELHKGGTYPFPSLETALRFARGSAREQNRWAKVYDDTGALIEHVHKPRKIKKTLRKVR